MNKSIKRTIAAVSMTAMLAAGFALPVSAATQVEVTGNPVMIRADAGLKNTVVSKAHKGDKYVYVGQKKDSTGRVWYNIKYSGNKTGWITSQFAKKTDDSAAEQPASTAQQVQITATPVNVRSGAGTNYKKLGKTSKGKTYTCLASKKDSSGRVWYQIQYTSKTKGWVMGSLAKLVGQTAAVKEDAFMKAIFKDVTSSDQYKEWKKMNPEATITEKLSGSTITFTVTGGLNIDGMDDEDFTNDKPVIAGTYVFKHNGDYVVYTSQDAKHLSNPFNAYILIAICDYYGMSFVTANEYIAAHPDNTYYIVDKKANTIKMYAAAKWNTATEPEQPASTVQQVQITSTPVNVRSGAGTNYKKLGKTSKGKTYTCLASKKDSSGRVWYQIQYTSKTKGWVTSQFAKPVETAATNPVKAYEGTYQSDRATVTVKASGKSDAKITVQWASSAWENSVWEMSGMFDPSVYRVDYGNGVRTDYVYKDNGDVSSKKVIYKNSTGRIQFKDKKTLVWRDENEQDNGEITFTKSN